MLQNSLVMTVSVLGLCQSVSSHTCSHSVTTKWSCVPYKCRFVSPPPLWLCDSDVAPSTSRRGGKGGRCCFWLYCWAPRSSSPPVRSDFRRVLTAKWFGPARHGWIFESAQLSVEVCWSRFLQKPGGACASCKLPDFATKELWVVVTDKRRSFRASACWR